MSSHEGATDRADWLVGGPRHEMEERWVVAYTALRDMVLGGELKPGARVREVELANRFGVSRGPVREALRILETEGLILRKPRMGSFVAPLTAEDSEEIYELRSCIEPLALQLSLKRRPAELVLALEGCLSRMREALDARNFARVVQMDLDFHTQYYDLSGNGRLRACWESLKGPMQLLIVASGGRDEFDWQAVVEGHVPILAAARIGDIDACIAETHRHLELARDRIGLHGGSSRADGDL